MSGEVCWDLGGGEERCGERYGQCSVRCKEVCWGVGPQHMHE